MIAERVLKIKDEFNCVSTCELHSNVNISARNTVVNSFVNDKLGNNFTLVIFPVCFQNVESDIQLVYISIAPVKSTPVIVYTR